MNHAHRPDTFAEAIHGLAFGALALFVAIPVCYVLLCVFLALGTPP